MDGVIHLAYVNGTEFFYSQPELVLEVGSRAWECAGRPAWRTKSRIGLASSSRSIKPLPRFPPPRRRPWWCPIHSTPATPMAGKIISELMTIHYGKRYFERVLIFRPHNVFGPDMGFEHVVPQFSCGWPKLSRDHQGRVLFPSRGMEANHGPFITLMISRWMMTMMEKGPSGPLSTLGPRKR